MNRYFAENSYLLDVQSEMQIGIWTIELLEDGTYVMYCRKFSVWTAQSHPGHVMRSGQTGYL